MIVHPLPAAGDASGLRLANGLCDQADGTIIALGTTVQVTGNRSDGPSARMAGPGIIIDPAV